MKTGASIQRWIAVAAFWLLVPLVSFSQSADDVQRWRSEAEAGDAQAKYKLGLRYFYGLDVVMDKAEAVI